MYVPVLLCGQWEGPWGVALWAPIAAVLVWVCTEAGGSGWHSEMLGEGLAVGKVWSLLLPQDAMPLVIIENII